MNVMKYCWPFYEFVENRTQMSVCINSKTPELLLTFNLHIFVCLSLIHSTQTMKSVKSSGSRILSDTRCSILCLEICPNYLCHNIEIFSIVLHFVPYFLTYKVLLIKVIISILYRLLIKVLVKIIFKF